MALHGLCQCRLCCLVCNGCCMRCCCGTQVALLGGRKEQQEVGRHAMAEVSGSNSTRWSAVDLCTLLLVLQVAVPESSSATTSSMPII